MSAAHSSESYCTDSYEMNWGKRQAIADGTGKAPVQSVFAEPRLLHRGSAHFRPPTAGDPNEDCSDIYSTHLS